MTEARKRLVELLSGPEPLESHEFRKYLEMIYEDEAKRRPQK